MAIGQTNVSMDDILYEKAGNPSKTPPLLNRKNISLYGLSVNGVADYQDATTSVGIDITGSPDQTAPYGMGEFRGYSQAYYREEMNPDYWTVTSSYNTSYNSGYWELAGQGVFDTLGGFGAPLTNFTTTMGGVTGIHYISALRTYIAANGAPLILILTIYNTTGTAYSTSGTITPTSLQAFTNSNYSSGQIVNVTFSSGSKSAGSQYINGSNKESMTITWSTTGYFMTDVFGTNTGYQNGNGTKYIQIV